MKININIDKLILHNFTPEEQTQIQKALTTEITKTLKNNNNFENNKEPLNLNVNTLKINTTANPQKIGHTIAQTIKNCKL